MSDQKRYLNRELSWLEFNQRVLDEANDQKLPLLERLRFLAITASNLDEFSMVRVGGLKMLAKQDVRRRDPAGLTPRQQLSAIGRRMQRLLSAQYACLQELEPLLAEAGIVRVRPSVSGGASQDKALERIFESEIFPVLTPMALSDEPDLRALRSTIPLTPHMSYSTRPRQHESTRVSRRLTCSGESPRVPRRLVCLSPGHFGWDVLTVVEVFELC